jgi:RNA polymerase sigma-70 factor (ECF subfamily)
MKNEAEVTRAIEAYSSTIRRICLVYLKNKEDAEDISQEVFLKYLLRKDDFESQAHEKAWLIRITINSCKDLLKSVFRKRVHSLEELDNVPSYIDARDHEVLDAVTQLPEKYRQVIYLQYYEGYTTPEIAKILNRNENTIYTWIARAKQELKKTLGGDLNE